MRPDAALALALAALLAAPAAHAEDPDLYEYGDQLLTLAIGPNKAPRAGRSRVLVVPVDLGTGGNFAALAPFFDPAPTAGYTFSNYLRRQSGDRLDVDTFVMDPIVFDGCPVDVPGCRFGTDNIGAAIEAIRQIFERLLAELPRPLSDFDLGGPDGVPDGWVDGVILLIPGYAGGIAPPVWPFLEVIADGVQVGHAAISQLDREIVLHEYGHNLGACDQYLWDFEHSLMSWCDDCSFDVHTRAKLGWASVVDVAPDTEVLAHLRPSVDAGPVLRVGGPSEYFLVEYRDTHKVGAKAVDPGLDGVLVVHVDETVRPPLLAQTDYPEHHALLEMEHPTDAASRTWFAVGDTLEPTPDHGPTTESQAWRDTNTYDGRRTGIRVSVEAADDSDPSAPFVRVRVRGPSAAGATPTLVDLTSPSPPADDPIAEPGPDVIEPPSDTASPDAAAPDTLGADTATDLPRSSRDGCAGAPPSAALTALLGLLALFAVRARHSPRG